MLLHCQNSATLKSAHELLRVLASSPKFANSLDSASVLNETLQDMGFSGLWRSCSFSFTQEQDSQCFILTEKLIEVCCSLYYILLNLLIIVIVNYSLVRVLDLIINIF